MIDRIRLGFVPKRLSGFLMIRHTYILSGRQENGKAKEDDEIDEDVKKLLD